MTHINKDRLLTTFLELVQIDSPSGDEAAVAAYCKRAFEEAGCTVYFDNSYTQTGSSTGNLFATYPSSILHTPEIQIQRPLPLYFSAHMDTVDPCLGVKPHSKEGYIYSDGTTVLGGDDKAGIAAIIELVRALAESGKDTVHQEIRIVLSVQEERGLIGAKALDPALFSHVQGAPCYVLDAAGKPGLVVNGAPYQYSYRAHFTGLASHAGLAPEAGISAIQVAAKALAALPQGRVDELTSTNVGTIQGGSANNVVAEECVVTGELRSHELSRIETLKARIESIFKATVEAEQSAVGSIALDISWEVNYEGFFAAKDSPQVALALKAARRIGLVPAIEISGGGADTNVLAALGLAAVSLGCGMENIHSTRERLAVNDLEDLARLALQIVLEETNGIQQKTATAHSNL